MIIYRPEVDFDNLGQIQRRQSVGSTPEIIISVEKRFTQHDCYRVLPGRTPTMVILIVLSTRLVFAQ